MRVRLLANGSHPWERWIRRWGVSFLVDEDILFDTFGDAQVLMDHLRRFQVDRSRIRHVVISHEHWDHVGGLQAFLNGNPDVCVYVPAHAPAALKEKIADLGARVVDENTCSSLRQGASLSREIVAAYGGGDVPEQALVLGSSQGLVLLVGCAHPGVGRMVDEVRKDFNQDVYAVMGGFHLKDRSPQDILTEARRLKDMGVRIVSPLHCSGARCQRIFRDIFQDGYRCCREGQEIVFGEQGYE